MIVSHKHKFIFVHLGRTSGRSVTAALAEHCGDEDIITPVPGIAGRNCEGFRRHDTASMIRNRIGNNCWEDYFKFTIERNPWDKILSLYWSHIGDTPLKTYNRVHRVLTGRPLSFRTWFELRIWQGRIRLRHVRFPQHIQHYTENGGVIIDFIGLYEHRAAHVAEISKRLGLAISPSYEHGLGLRKDRRHYTEYFNARMNAIVEREFRMDLDLLGYRFGEPAPETFIET